MRLISGRFKGFELQTPKSGTRPTTDFAKEGIFSHLEAENMLDGVSVLDLYAGTGALGFESLSRGATALTLVDSAPRAASLLRQAATRIRSHRSWDSAMSVSVEQIPAERYVQRLARTETDRPSFDLVFLDPPYALLDEEFDAVIASLAATGTLTDVCEIAAERSAQSRAPRPPQGWEIEETRKYGETRIYYIVRTQD